MGRVKTSRRNRKSGDRENAARSAVSRDAKRSAAPPDEGRNLPPRPHRDSMDRVPFMRFPKDPTMTTTLCLLVASTFAVAQAQVPTKKAPSKTAPAQGAAADRWEKDIVAFEAHDKTDPPKRDGVLFVGASSIRLWDVKKAFPDLPCTNRGFGGSQMGDSLRYADRIVIPYEPRVIVVMAGGNDIAAGDTPEQVRDDFQALVTKVHAKLPKTKIYYLSLYPSVRRVAIDDKIRQVNELIGAIIKGDPRLGYIDVRTRLGTADGGPRPDLLREDGLHLNDKGYAVCNEIVGPILRKEMKSVK